MTASGFRLENHVELNRRDLLLLSCLVYSNISEASSKVLFPSFIYDFFIHICFGFETKLANGKLSVELRPVLKYNLKEQD